MFRISRFFRALKIVCRFTLALVMALGFGGALAAPTADEMIQGTVSALIDELEERRVELEADHSALYALV